MREVINDVQANVGRFNHEEAVWHGFVEKRARRRKLFRLLRSLKMRSSLSRKQDDHVDWAAAEQEMHRSNCVGILLP